MKVLSEIEVVQRALARNSEDVKPLLKYIGMDASKLKLVKASLQHDATEIVGHLRRMGSNDIATLFRGEGVSYAEVVCDVGHKVGVKEVAEYNSIEQNEALIIQKFFADALDNMSDEERVALLSSLGIKDYNIPYGAAGLLISQIMLKQFGGFAIYKMSLVMANVIARAILGAGLSFATNAAISRSIGLLVGPVGWVVSGAWLAIDLAGPAFRKTVPAVVHMAMLRQIIKNKVNIGIVGEGSSGKDAMLKAVFNVDTKNVNPVAGSTKDTAVFQLGDSGAVDLINYPGFNDVREDVNKLTSDSLALTDIFVMVVDLNRGISAVEISGLDSIRKFNRPILVCLNKVDLVRPSDKDLLVKAAKERLSGVEFIETSFDPDVRLHRGGYIGAVAVLDWIVQKLKKLNKETSHIKKDGAVAVL